MAAARSMVGVRFRPQGRDRSGVDCLGLVLLSAAAAGIRVPPLPAFGLRGTSEDEARIWLARVGLTPRADGRAMAGDILLSVPASAQVHLAVATPDGLVEADAALRRVVERPRGQPARGSVAEGRMAWSLPMEEG